MPKGRSKISLPTQVGKEINPPYTKTKKNNSVKFPYNFEQYKDEKFDWCINTKFLRYHNEDDKRFRIYKESIDALKDIFNKLDSYRGWNWRAIEGKNGTSCGYMEIEKLAVKDMVFRHLQACGRDDDVLYKMEINNHHRVWGIRDGSVFHWIWDDNGHFFYKHRNDNYSLQHAG